MSLYDELTRIGRQIESQLQLMKNNEDATILVSVQPFIRALGYDTQNLAEVYPQYNADPKAAGGEKVDYAILREGEPVVLIEAKAAQKSLNENNWKQLHLYFNALDVRVGVLTNGLEYRFYTDLKKNNIMDTQPFLTIDMLELDERSVAALKNFMKPHFDIKKIVGFAQRQEIQKLLRQEMENPSDALVDHFARDLHHGRMSANDRKQYRNLLRDAWRDLIDMNVPPPIIQPPPTPKPKPPVDPEYIPIHGYHDGHRIQAEILRQSIVDGLTVGGHCIRFEGKLMNTTVAAVSAIQSVNPSFVKTKGNPNGFQFWRVVDPDGGKEHMIRRISNWDGITDEALRQRVLAAHFPEDLVNRDRGDNREETLVFPNINIPLRKTYLGELCEATLVHLDVTEAGYWEAKIKVGGEDYTPSGAAKIVAKRMNPKVRDVGGWDFWRVIDPADNRERPIKDLGRDRDLLRRVMDSNKSS